MAYIAYANGKRKEIAPAEVTLERAQVIVGGYVELVAPRATPGIIFLCDEDGHSKANEALLMHGKEIPLNIHGCELYGDLVIVGDIIVLTRAEAKGRWL